MATQTAETNNGGAVSPAQIQPLLNEIMGLIGNAARLREFSYDIADRTVRNRQVKTFWNRVGTNCDRIMLSCAFMQTQLLWPETLESRLALSQTLTETGMTDIDGFAEGIYNAMDEITKKSKDMAGIASYVLYYVDRVSAQVSELYLVRRKATRQAPAIPERFAGKAKAPAASAPAPAPAPETPAQAEPQAEEPQTEAPAASAPAPAPAPAPAQATQAQAQDNGNRPPPVRPVNPKAGTPPPNAPAPARRRGTR